MFQFLVICLSPVTATDGRHGLPRTVNRPMCFNPCGNYTQATSAQAKSQLYCRLHNLPRRLLSECHVFVEGGNSGEALLRILVVVTGYPLHTPVSTSLPLLRADWCHHTVSRPYWRASKFATTHFWTNSLTPFGPQRKKHWNKTQKRWAQAHRVVFTIRTSKWRPVSLPKSYR
jgi:hypothetical protein